MKKILIVDDDQSICILLQEFITTLGYSVVMANDGTAAIKVFNAETPDLVITDLIMPESNGINLLKEIKMISKSTPVIILTGAPSVDAAVQCLKTGATDFLSKPIDFAHLEQVIAKSMETVVDAEGTLFMPTKDTALNVAGYRVKRTLGVGNFGVVYLAEHEESGRNVALKVLKSDPYEKSSAALDTKRRFSREAVAVSRIRHANIVEVYEYSVDMNIKIPYIAMEYVAGKSLKEMLPVLRDEDLTTRIRLLRYIALGLSEIHREGLCHRDIKPHNILVGPDLFPKITDFGIVSIPDSQLTRDSNLLGTPAYMSPEAFFSAKVDHRSDIFSFGIVCYEVLLGKRPFNGENIAAISGAIRSGRPLEPRKIHPEFPMQLQDILARMLRKDVESRYQHAADLIHDFDLFLRGDQPKTALVEYLKSRVLMRDWS